jgi:DNA modification methylase
VVARRDATPPNGSAVDLLGSRDRLVTDGLRWLGDNRYRMSVRLEWDGKPTQVERISLPFQTVETINESRATRERDAGALFGGNGAVDEAWRNQLIWGDNKLVMSSLLNEFAGQIKLIYIDPPFATGDDFSVSVQIGDSDIDKEPSILEEHAYRDTWGKGLDSYLSMMFERLVLVKELLSDDGTLFLHCDWHVGHYLKVLADEVFGSGQLINEIAWCYTGPGSPGMKQFNRKHDTIFWYAKGDAWTFNADDVRIPHDAKTQENFKQGLTGSGFVAETYDLASGGKVPEDWWPLAIAARYPIDGVKRAGYATEKPWPLIERIVKTGSGPSDVVADFFAGSGILAAVAESLGRRWIVCDLGRFATQNDTQAAVEYARLSAIRDPQPRLLRAPALAARER